MFSVGETLRRARLEQRLDVAAVAARTKINAKYLEAIESDDRKALPSAFFYKSFVHQYAGALSLDTNEIDAEVDRVLHAEAPLPLPGQGDAILLSVPRVTVTPRFRKQGLYTTLATLAALAVVVVGCSAVYVWWHSARSSGTATAKVSAPAIAGSSAPRSQAKPDLHAMPVSLATSPAPSSTPPATAATPGYKVLLDLLAHEETWLSVSSDGKPVFSGLLQPNQSKVIEGKEFAKIRVGNAGGLEVRLNGRLLGPLGNRGQVLVVLFTPDNFQIVAVPKESD
jgi:cytoskeletal protein RodZ